MLKASLNFLLQYLTGARIPRYTPPPPTDEPLEWADLAIIDFSKCDTAEGMKELADQVLQAMTTHGFFYIVNHGYTTRQRKSIFDVANATFDLVNEEEKKKYTGQSIHVYEGYKPRQTWTIENGVTDQIEHYNINHIVRNKSHPKIVSSRLDEIQSFADHNHKHILYNILRLLAIGLELPEETFVKEHLFEDEGQSSVRFMKYYPRTQTEEQQTKNVWLKGHTDIGSITILWSQPISGLQILSPDGKWRYIRHIDDALVINTGDVMQLLSGGFLKPTIHRVVQPPKDQTQLERLGVFYFAMASDQIKLAPHYESPVLQRLGVGKVDNAPTMAEWRKERTEKYGRTVLVKSEVEKNVEQDVVCGIVVKEYN